MLWRPHAEMVEKASAVVLRIAVPGLDKESVQVTATPNSLLVQGTGTHHHQRLNARLHFCEFGRRIFRRFDLPSGIDPSKVSATLDKGILEIVATLAAASAEGQQDKHSPRPNYTETVMRQSAAS